MKKILENNNGFDVVRNGRTSFLVHKYSNKIFCICTYANTRNIRDGVNKNC